MSWCCQRPRKVESVCLANRHACASRGFLECACIPSPNFSAMGMYVGCICSCILKVSVGFSNFPVVSCFWCRAARNPHVRNTHSLMNDFPQLLPHRPHLFPRFFPHGPQLVPQFFPRQPQFFPQFFPHCPQVFPHFSAPPATCSIIFRGGFKFLHNSFRTAGNFFHNLVLNADNFSHRENVEHVPSTAGKVWKKFVSTAAKVWGKIVSTAGIVKKIAEEKCGKNCFVQPERVWKNFVATSGKHVEQIACHSR